MSNQTLRCSGYESHYRDAEHDAAWLIDQLAERDTRIVGLEARAAAERVHDLQSARSDCCPLSKWGR